MSVVDRVSLPVSLREAKSPQVDQFVCRDCLVQDHSESSSEFGDQYGYLYIEPLQLPPEDGLRAVAAAERHRGLSYLSAPRLKEDHEHGGRGADTGSDLRHPVNRQSSRVEMALTE